MSNNQKKKVNELKQSYMTEMMKLTDKGLKTLTINIL